MAEDNPDKTARKTGGKPADAASAVQPVRSPRTLSRRELETLRARLQTKFH